MDNLKEGEFIIKGNTVPTEKKYHVLNYDNAQKLALSLLICYLKIGKKKTPKAIKAKTYELTSLKWRICN